MIKALKLSRNLVAESLSKGLCQHKITRPDKIKRILNGKGALNGNAGAENQRLCQGTGGGRGGPGRKGWMGRRPRMSPTP